jgi:hypothetical protein
MRTLLGIVTVLALIWSAWWAVGRVAVGRAVEAGLAAAGAAGIEAGAEATRIAGYPNRFDVTFERPRLADPAAGLVWEGPFLQIFSLSYRPWHVILALPPEQTLTLPGAQVGLASERLQASLRLRPAADLPLDQAILAGEALRLALPGGAEVATGPARAALAADPSRAAGYRAGLTVEGIALPGPAGPLPARAERLHVDAGLTFDAPLDRHAGQTRPRLVRVELREGTLAWGPLRLTARGTLAPDAAGRAEGRIELRVTGWREGLGAAAALGLLDPGLAPVLERMGEALAAAGGAAGAGGGGTVTEGSGGAQEYGTTVEGAAVAPGAETPAEGLAGAQGAGATAEGLAGAQGGGTTAVDTSGGPGAGALTLPLTFAGGRISLGALPLGPAPAWP